MAFNFTPTVESEFSDVAWAFNFSPMDNRIFRLVRRGACNRRIVITFLLETDPFITNQAALLQEGQAMLAELAPED